MLMDIKLGVLIFCCKVVAKVVVVFFGFATRPASRARRMVFQFLQHGLNDFATKCSTRPIRFISVIYAKKLPCCKIAEFFPKISQSVGFCAADGLKAARHKTKE